MSKNRILLILLSTLILCPWQCYESIDGCLDSRALNFNPEADEEDDCDYPKLTLKWEYLFNDDFFSPGDTIQAGNPLVRVLDFYALGNQVYLHTPSATVSMLEEEVLDFDRGNGIERSTLTDDIFLLSPARFTQNIGTFIYEGQVDSLSLVLSPSLLQGLQPDQWSSGHPAFLAEQRGMFALGEEQTSGMRFTFQIDADTIQFFFGTGMDIAVSGPSDTVLDRATSLEIKAMLDLNVWFDNVTWATLDSLSLSDLVKDNTSNAIKIGF